MIPTYVIACDELPERKAAAATHLADRGVDFTFWRGIHGKTWGLRTALEYEPGSRISPGHVGLNLGHWTLWNHLLATLPRPEVLGGNDAAAVVFEDDVSLPGDWHGRLDDVLRELIVSFPAWQFVFLGLAETEPHVWHKVTDRVGGPDSRLCRMADPFGTHAYLVRRSALPELIDRMTAAERNMDQQLYARVLKDMHVRWCAVLPTLVEQRTFDYRQAGKPEWSPSCIDDILDTAFVGAFRVLQADEQDVKRLCGADVPGRPSPELIEATTSIVDPFPCIYRGEGLSDVGTDHAGRPIPLFQCGRLNRPCFDRKHASVPVRTPASPSVFATPCELCSLRTSMPGLGKRPRLPLPDGHFNPSVAVWDGRVILATRDSWGHSKVALWELENSHTGWKGDWTAKPIGSFASAHPDAPRLEDPRLFTAPDPETGAEHLCAMFNLPDGYPPKRVRVGYVRFARDLSGIVHTEVFRSPFDNLYEKNWVPFHAAGELRWVYSTKPRHCVLGETQAWETDNPLPWCGGAVRGGAAPVLVPGLDSVPRDSGDLPEGRGRRGVYYHFFHGCLKRIQGSVYTVGCVVFEADPPFRVLRQTPSPLLWPDLPGPGEDVVKRFVVWPGGAVRYAGAWHLALGVDDSHCRIVRIPFREVEDALSDVPETSPATSIRDTPVVNGVREGDQ